ncbi:MAG TPA: AAA family ATPase [Dehalococcoidia bacterium]|nr:AAA family ATPase [Dehalococcoidia bacterium]
MGKLPIKKSAGPPPMPPKPKKTFSVKRWSGEKEGEKVVVYADSGMGKTTLVAQMTGMVFIGLDDGGSKIKNPITSEDLLYVPEVKSYQDVRDALQQIALFDDAKGVCIDTATYLEMLAEPWLFSHVPNSKGQPVTNLKAYGWNEGYKHLYDAFSRILQDLDGLKRMGKHVILICQADSHKIPYPGGEDYLKYGPRLYNGKPSNMAQVAEWADHIFHIGYQQFQVKERKATGDTTRVIFADGDVHFYAKSRTLRKPVISFDTPQDDSLWRFLLGDNYNG